MDSEPLKHYMKELAVWLAKPYEKSIKILIDTTDYDTAVESIDAWVAASVTKYICVAFESLSYSGYLIASLEIDTWVEDMPTKKIKVEFESKSHTDFWTKTAKVDKWVDATAKKVVNIVFGNYDAFANAANKITSWANQTLTKTINVVINETTRKTTTNSGGNSMNTGYGSWINDVGDLVDNWLNDVNKGIKETVDDIFGNKKYVKPGGWYASGGFPKQGELFIANEQGAELVGSIGGKTAVANNQQIVDGISAGIRDANSEQNALLRRQNELLQRILEKDSSVRFGASAALGRVAKQSIDMYNTATGG